VVVRGADGHNLDLASGEDPIDHGSAIVNSVRVSERRTYRSSTREAQARRTRRRILDAATAVFLDRGFAGATMRQVADRAGVSVPTVESLFGTKARLLKAAIDVAIAGDDEPISVLDRPWATDAAAAERLEEFLARVATVLAEAQQRSARLVVVCLEAADVDPSLRSLADDRLAQRARTAEWIADGLLARAPLRPRLDRGHAVDTIWLLMDPAVFVRLTEDRRWSAGRYRDWFGDSVRRLLTD
jgi:TetR/AcrR family transcriptional regulator, regulator of autoinduction and epiphytic fitness